MRRIPGLSHWCGSTLHNRGVLLSMAPLCRLLVATVIVLSLSVLPSARAQHRFRRGIVFQNPLPRLLRAQAALKSPPPKPKSTAPRPPPPNPCLKVKCPSTASCETPQGPRVPVCKCPGNQRLVVSPTSSTQYVCTSAAGGAGSEYVDRHNMARAAVQSPPLVWDASLAQLAQAWADKLRNTGSCRPKFGDYGPYGQNVIAAVAEKPQNGSAPVDAWISNGNLYSLALFQPSKDQASGCSTGNYAACLPYVQTIWQYTTKIGCGTAICQPAQVWVCNYDPPGLLNGLYPFSPCATVSCTSPQVCDPFLGLPATCAASPCSQVVCPANSNCALTTDTVPYCTCKAGYSMFNQTCVVTPAKSSIPQTSLVVYQQEKFAGPAWVLRPPIPPVKKISCTNLPQGFATNGIRSLKIRWSVDDAPAKLPSLSAPARCKAIVFWNLTNCAGASATFLPTTGFYTAWETKSSLLTRIAKSVQCG